MLSGPSDYVVPDDTAYEDPVDQGPHKLCGNLSPRALFKILPGSWHDGAHIQGSSAQCFQAFKAHLRGWQVLGGPSDYVVPDDAAYEDPVDQGAHKLCRDLPSRPFHGNSGSRAHAQGRHQIRPRRYTHCRIPVAATLFFILHLPRSNRGDMQRECRFQTVHCLPHLTSNAAHVALAMQAWFQIGPSLSGSSSCLHMLEGQK